MLAICDVNEYRKCVKEFNVEVVTQLFDTLHSLCNLLVVVPENLKKICSGEQLVSELLIFHIYQILDSQASVKDIKL